MLPPVLFPSIPTDQPKPSHLSRHPRTNHPRLEQNDLYDLYDLYDLFPLDGLDLSGQIDIFLICMI